VHCEIDAAYRRVKTTLVEVAGDDLPRVVLFEIHRAITRRWLLDRGLVPEAPCATVAFRETMGYTIARLEPGASSHNNDPRPFTVIPDPLAGKSFTQVVSCSVSPIEVEFLTAGKLYVLVGTDWDGYYPATSWLRKMGYKESLSTVETSRGTGFEVWSLFGQNGDTLVLPTQVMLVAEHLIQGRTPYAYPESIR
jgi:hypothetical protein